MFYQLQLPCLSPANKASYMTQILQQQIDNGGNVNWVLIDSTQTFMDSSTASVYIQTLDPNQHYMAQVWSSPTTATILAVT